MRLTSKGAARIADEIVVHHSEHCEPVLNMTELENCQFEQSDFEGAVVLTKQEADRVIEALLDAEMQIENDDTESEINALVRMLGDRYKQAEGKE